MDATEEELFEVGVKADGGAQEDEDKFISYDDLLYNTDLDPEIKAVVVSHDPRYNHTKMCMASITLQQPNIKFIAATDELSTKVKGRRMPGVGTNAEQLLHSLNCENGSLRTEKPEYATHSTADFIKADQKCTDEEHATIHKLLTQHQF